MDAIKCTQCGAPLKSDTCEYCEAWYPNLQAELIARERALNPVRIWNLDNGLIPFKDLLEQAGFDHYEIE